MNFYRNYEIARKVIDEHDCVLPRKLTKNMIRRANRVLNSDSNKNRADFVVLGDRNETLYVTSGTYRKSSNNAPVPKAYHNVAWSSSYYDCATSVVMICVRESDISDIIKMGDYDLLAQALRYIDMDNNAINVLKLKYFNKVSAA